MSRDEKDPTSDERRRAIVRAAVGMVVGIALGVGITFLVIGDDPDTTPANTDRTDRDRLLAAWARSQRATYTLEGAFRRTPAEGEGVDDPLVVVQHGEEDRIALGYGSWDGVVGGRSVRCLRTGRSGEFRDCTVGDAVDRRETNRAELDELARLTDPDSPVYRVTALDGGCFLLTVVEGQLPTTHGRRGRYCFDRATGALARTRIEHAGAVDEVIVTSLTGKVDPADLPPTG